jgi:hypothetical protein
MGQDTFVSRVSRGSPISETIRGAVLRGILSVVIPVVWISTTLVFLAFWATGFTFFQDFVIAIVSLLALFGVITAMWISFGVRLIRRWAVQ